MYEIVLRLPVLRDRGRGLRPPAGLRRYPDGGPKDPRRRSRTIAVAKQLLQQICIDTLPVGLQYRQHLTKPNTCGPSSILHVSLRTRTFEVCKFISTNTRAQATTSSSWI